MAILTETKARSMKPGDKPLPDGKVTGLRLHPHSREKGRGQWKLRFISPSTKQRRDMGLGAYPDVSIADARAKAEEARRLLASGVDPIVERSRTEVAAQVLEDRAMTFETAARRRFEELSPGFKNSKHKQQWINTLQTYVFPEIGTFRLSDLKASHFSDVLRPIWLLKIETAQRVRQRCSEVMDWAYSQDLVQGNPVRVVDKLLPRQPAKSQRVQHHPALPWRKLPEFYAARLSKPTSSTTSLLAFIILTAARSGEGRGATWSEIDFEQKIWTVPAERTKTRRLHRVPLSEAALIVLDRQKVLSNSNALVFPAPRGGMLSDMAVSALLRRHWVPSDVAGRTATAHGFRSTFRDWASESGYARDLAERALAHAVKNQSEAAYHRTDNLDQRREMMEAWGEFARSGI